MTPQEAINKLNSLKQYYNDKNEDSYVGFDNEDNEALDMAIKALEAQNSHIVASITIKGEDLQEIADAVRKELACENCIRRKDVIRLVEQYPSIIGSRCSGLIADIKHLPSVIPKQKVGKWIDDGWYAEGHSEHAYRCSECDENYIGYVGEYNYCPNCGVKMAESEE